MEIFDITIPLNADTPVWEGDEGVKLSQVASLKKGDGFNVSWLEMGVHSGTHIDAPFHLFDHGKTVDKIPLEKLVGEAHVLSIPQEVKVITSEVLVQSGFDGQQKKLLLKTSNSNLWEKDPHTFNKNFSAIDTACAQFLAEKKIELIGIDYFSISPIKELKPPHEILLNSDIVILENINLFDVNPGVYMMFCLPINLTGADGAPARVILVRN